MKLAWLPTVHVTATDCRPLGGGRLRRFDNRSSSFPPARTSSGSIPDAPAASQWRSSNSILPRPVGSTTGTKYDLLTSPNAEKRRWHDRCHDSRRPVKSNHGPDVGIRAALAFVTPSPAAASASLEQAPPKLPQGRCGRAKLESPPGRALRRDRPSSGARVPTGQNNPRHPAGSEPTAQFVATVGVERHCPSMPSRAGLSAVLPASRPGPGS